MGAKDFFLCKEETFKKMCFDSGKVSQSCVFIAIELFCSMCLTILLLAKIGKQDSVSKRGEH